MVGNYPKHNNDNHESNILYLVYPVNLISAVCMAVPNAEIWLQHDKQSAIVIVPKTDGAWKGLTHHLLTSNVVITMS